MQKNLTFSTVIELLTKHYLRKGFPDKISVIRILDSRRQNFKLSKAYEHKVDVINVITAPEIEMLIIFNENKYNCSSIILAKP